MKIKLSKYSDSLEVVQKDYLLLFGYKFTLSLIMFAFAGNFGHGR